MPKGRQPVIKPAFQKMYGDSWIECVQRDYSGITPEEAHKKFQKAVGSEPIVAQGSIYAFLLKEIEGFSFAPSGKRKGGHFAKLSPALEKAFGENWQEGFKKICDGLTIEDATERINKDLGISISTATVSNKGREIGIAFKETPKIINPNAKKRGKTNLTLLALLEHYKTEEALKAALQALSGKRIKDIAESINKDAGTDIPPGNLNNLLKKYEINLSCTRNRKSANSEIPVDSDVPEGVEVPNVTRNTIPVQFTCQTPKCEGVRGQMVDLEFGLGLRARRCSVCDEFGTFKAQYRKPDGTIANVILKDIDGISSEVDESETPQEIGI
jgi:hypothetical protein